MNKNFKQLITTRLKALNLSEFRLRKMVEDNDGRMYKENFEGEMPKFKKDFLAIAKALKFDEPTVEGYLKFYDRKN